MEQSAYCATVSFTNCTAASGCGVTEDNPKPQDGFLTKVTMQQLLHITVSTACFVRILENLLVNL
jgi:hypothetical protein